MQTAVPAVMQLPPKAAIGNPGNSWGCSNRHSEQMISRFTVPTCLQILEQRYSVISALRHISPMRQQ